MWWLREESLFSRLLYLSLVSWILLSLLLLMSGITVSSIVCTYSISRIGTHRESCLYVRQQQQVPIVDSIIIFYTPILQWCVLDFCDRRVLGFSDRRIRMERPNCSRGGGGGNDRRVVPVEGTGDHGGMVCVAGVICSLVLSTQKAAWTDREVASQKLHLLLYVF